MRVTIRSLWGWSWCWFCTVSSIIIEEIVKLAMILHTPFTHSAKYFPPFQRWVIAWAALKVTFSLCEILSSCCESWPNTGMFGITNAYTHHRTVSFSTSLPSSLLLFRRFLSAVQLILVIFSLSCYSSRVACSSSIVFCCSFSLSFSSFAPLPPLFLDIQLL